MIKPIKLIFLIPLFFCCKKQTNNQYHFKAEIEGLKDSTKVYLFNYDAHKLVDSTLIKDSKFEFEGLIDYPFSAAIGVPTEELIVQFWIEQGKITLENVNKEQLVAIGMNLSPYVESENLSQIIKKYKKKTSKYQERKRFLSKQVKAGLTSSSEYDKIIDTIYKKTYNFFIENPNNYFSLSELINYSGGYSKKQLQDYFNKLSTKLKKSPKGIILKNYIEIPRVKVGEVAPSISAKTIENEIVSLSDFKGKYVLLDFWASWCTPCIKKIQKVYPKVQENFINENFQIVSYSFDQDKTSWKNMSKKLNINWANISNLTKMNKSPVAFAYDVSEIPTSFLIDPDGKIIKRIESENDIIEVLENIFDKK